MDNNEFTPTNPGPWQPISTAPATHMFRALICGGTLMGVTIGERLMFGPQGEKLNGATWEDYGFFGREIHTPEWWQPLPARVLKEWEIDLCPRGSQPAEQ